MASDGNQRQSRGFLPGAKALARVIRRVAEPALRKRGYLEAGLAADWPAIVGPFLAERCVPMKISWPRGQNSGGTLELNVESALAPELQHLEPQIVERINAYFGFAALERLKFIHGPRPAARTPRLPATRPLSEAEEAALAAKLAAVESQGLKGALQALGRRVMGASNPLPPAPGHGR
jgi:hypothetical protein